LASIDFFFGHRYTSELFHHLFQHIAEGSDNYVVALVNVLRTANQYAMRRLVDRGGIARRPGKVGQKGAQG
jgi:hypothetical protein